MNQFEPRVPEAFKERWSRDVYFVYFYYIRFLCFICWGPRIKSVDFFCGKSASQPINTEVMCMIYKPWIVESPTNNYMRWRKTLEGALGENILSQGTVGCTPNNVPMVFIVFNLGILGDYKTHYIGLISGFPMTGYAGIGVHPCLSPD